MFGVYPDDVSLLPVLCIPPLHRPPPLPHPHKSNAGRSLVQRRGPSALFVGIVPRLVQQVPSSTICWFTVEACQKALQPWTDGQPASGGI